MSIVSKLSSKKKLLFFLLVAIFILSASWYVASNYGAPQLITVQLKTQKNALFSVYYDVGEGYGEDYKVSQLVTGSNNFQIIKLKLPWKHIKSFRIDPLTEPGIEQIKSIELSNAFGQRHMWMARDILKDFYPQHDIRKFDLIDDSILIESVGNDPYFVCTVPLSPISEFSAVFMFAFFIIILTVFLLFIRFLERHKKNPFDLYPLAWLGIIMFSALLARSYHITYPLNDMHAFRQTQTAGLIRDFYRDGINLLYPRLITLGNPGYVILEFPLYQALASLFYRFLTPDIIWARLLSISFGLLSVFFIYRITMKFMVKKAAIFAALFFAFAPLTIFYNRVPMPDSLTILLSLIMLDFMIEGINNKNTILLILGIFAGCLGMMMKSPYVAPLYLPIIYLTYKEGGRLKSLLNVRFLSSFLIPFAVMIIWQRHANSVNDMYFNTNDYPFKDLYSFVVVKLHPFNNWYFGTIAQRLELKNYLMILKRIFLEILCVEGVLFLIVGFGADIRKKAGMFFYIWLFSVFCSIMIIFNLNIFHNFYQLPLVPILAILCGAGVSRFVDWFRNKKIAVAITVILISLYLFISGLVAAKFFEESNNLLEVGQFIDNSIEKDSMIAVSQPGDDLWTPVLMYYSDRHGFDVPHYRLNGEMIEYLKGKDIKYLAIVDYNGDSDSINSVISAHPVIAKNDRAMILDIAPK
jgi:4-amino-4-deoxy-L-arabinose transferase-like glycosyltransferase